MHRKEMQGRRVLPAQRMCSKCHTLPVSACTARGACTFMHAMQIFPHLAVLLRR